MRDAPAAIEDSRILIVDDSPVNIVLLNAMLDWAGLATSTARPTRAT